MPEGFPSNTLPISAPVERPRAAPVADNMQSRFVDDPLLVYWEMTRACDLACVHCRASAIARRHPRELSTEEGRRLLERIAAFGDPQRRHLILTGGDPIQRADLFALVAYARELGLLVSVTPAATRRLTDDIIVKLSGAGVTGLGLSLDGSNPQRHDTLRGEPGSFAWTIAAARAARREGLPLQVNTIVSSQTLHDIPAIYEVMSDLDVTRWALFFLIGTGRGRELQEISPAAAERLLNWLWRITPEAPFAIKTTEAHHFRRIAYHNLRRTGLRNHEICQTPVGRGFGVRDGNGTLFVSHTGELFPSGFLPLPTGNVRRDDLVEVYRHHQLFRRLRDSDTLVGKCGCCEFRVICGGSRARAYATTGDPFASDPICPYIPRPLRRQAAHNIEECYDYG